MKNYRIGLYEKAMPNLTWNEKLQTTKELGFDFLEISIDETDEKLARLDMSNDVRLGLVSLMNKHDIRIESICLSGHRKYPLGGEDEAIQKKSLEIAYKAILLAKDLGVRHIQLAGYDVYYDESNQQTQHNFLNNLIKVVSFASQHGVLLGFETMETDFMNTIQKSSKYVELLNSPYLKIYPDIGNVTNAHDNNLEHILHDIESNKEHIIAIHLKEVVPNVFREVPFGTGITNFKEIITRAKALGINRYVMECWYVGSVNWEMELEQDLSFLKEFLESED